MYKKNVLLCIITCFTVYLLTSILNLFKVSVFATDFIEMVNILNSESHTNPTYEKGLFFAKTLFIAFVSTILLLLIITIFLFRQFKLKYTECFIDPLCNTYNKRFLKKINKKYKDFNNFSVLIIDIDYFKKYNDNYGHSKGDEIISYVANLLKKNSREQDNVIRFGGEEFCILLPKTLKEEAICIANNILKAIDEAKIEHLYSPISPQLTLSIGISTNNNCMGYSLSELINLADMELYKAKSNGRNQYSCF